MSVPLLAGYVLAAVLGSDAAHVPDPVSLPTEDMVATAIARVPEVRLAESRLEKARAEAMMRRTGSHEFELTVVPQHRDVTGSGSVGEWEAELSRGIRWPSKARIDGEIASLLVETAALELEDAHHATARRLLASWSAWLRAAARRRQAEAVVALWNQDREQIRRRVELGDAARRDLIGADAIVAQAEADLARASAAEESARVELGARFPSLALPASPHLPDRAPVLDGEPGQWIRRIAERSHEIAAAESRAREMDAEARRSRADRLADPRIGLRMLDEQGGRERALGIVFSIPFGGRYRTLQSEAASAEASAASALSDVVRRDVMLEAERSVLAVRAAGVVWRTEREAAEKSVMSTAKVERAYALGEANLTEVLTARRAEADAALAERTALIDAQEAVARVEIDAHERWHPRDHREGGLPGSSAASGHRLPGLGEPAD